LTTTHIFFRNKVPWAGSGGEGLRLSINPSRYEVQNSSDFSRFCARCWPLKP